MEKEKEILRSGQDKQPKETTTNKQKQTKKHFEGKAPNIHVCERYVFLDTADKNTAVSHTVSRKKTSLTAFTAGPKKEEEEGGTEAVNRACRLLRLC